MEDIRVRNNYFDWLCELIGGKGNHGLLLHKLFTTEFYWLVDFDDDRAKDGKDLRRTFLNMIQSEDLTGLNYVSVLEVLVALAISCEDNLMGNRDYGDRTPEWFWMMITNLGLQVYSDSNWSLESENDIAYILDIWLSRKYQYNGVGGAFPLQICHTDQRKINLWYQLQAYLQENFEF